MLILKKFVESKSSLVRDPKMSNSITFTLNIPVEFHHNGNYQVSVSFGQPYFGTPKSPVLPNYQSEECVQKEQNVGQFVEKTTTQKKANSLEINWSEDGF